MLRPLVGEGLPLVSIQIKGMAIL